MAVILGNKYQSKQRDNFRKIVGISDAYEKIAPENYERIYGSYNAVYFNGNTAASGSTGQPNGGGGDDDDPNKPGGGGGGGGGGVCECVDISADLLGKDNICCLNGFDCETEKPLQLLLDDSDYFKADIDCQDDIENGSNAQVIFGVGGTGVTEGCCRNSTSSYYQCLTLQQALSLFNSMKGRVSSTCPGTSSVLTDTNTTTETNGGAWRGTLEYRENHAKISGCSNQNYNRNVSIRIYSNGNYCQNIIENPNKSKFFLNNGKFYNMCDPYGNPPTECITMCDSEGNRFEVCGDGSITPL